MQYGKLAKVYDEFMSGVDYGMWSRYIAQLLSTLTADKGLPAPKSVFECGCGTGNISIPLSKLGFSVTASDISDEMLAVASEKARRAGRFIPFVRMDMRNIALHRPADAIVACCDAVNYLTCREDLLLFFKSAYASLKKGGLLLFDVSSEYKLQNILGNNCFSDSRQNAVYFWRNDFDERTRLIRMELDFFVKSAKDPALYERFTENHIQMAHTQSELVSALEEAGFRDIGVYGAFTFEPPKAESERLQFLAFKLE